MVFVKMADLTRLLKNHIIICRLCHIKVKGFLWIKEQK